MNQQQLFMPDRFLDNNLTTKLCKKLGRINKKIKNMKFSAVHTEYVDTYKSKSDVPKS